MILWEVKLADETTPFVPPVIPFAPVVPPGEAPKWTPPGKEEPKEEPKVEAKEPEVAPNLGDGPQAPVEEAPLRAVGSVAGMSPKMVELHKKLSELAEGRTEDNIPLSSKYWEVRNEILIERHK